MSFQRKGIENVRAVTLPDGIKADGRFTGLSRTALLTWQSDLVDVLFQTYVNGQLAGVTIHSDQRQLVVQAPASFDAAVHVEIIAVSRTSAHIDFGNQLAETNSDRQRVTLTLLRSQGLPADARLNFYFDAGSGEMDYNTPINPSPIPVWPCRQDKAGFGTAMFGTSDFGLDSAACIGFGKGCYGLGEFGMDADTIQWVSPILAGGTYRFGVVVTDEHGNASPPRETVPFVVAPPARPAASLDIVAFDPQIDRLTLRISDHART
jgi:hypothetical protein